MTSIISGCEFLLRGGFMMLPLLVSALIALTVIIERGYLFVRYFKTSPQITIDLFKKIRSGKWEEVKLFAKASHGPMGAVLREGMEHFEDSVEEMELSMKNCAEEWIPLLEKRLGILDTVITLAPLLGLLGTITGMMSSFRILSEKGVNEPHAVTAGVAEALIATATGLVIASICLVAFNYFSARVKSLVYEIESMASKLVEVRLHVDKIKKAE